MENESLKEELEKAQESIAVQASIIADGREREWKLESEIQQLAAKIQNLESQIADREAEFATVATDREDLAQLKKEVKEAAAEIYREGQAMEALKTRWQGELSNAKSELADAKATILKQGEKVRELERGYNFKPNPVESALRLKIGELQAELETYKQQPETDTDIDPIDLTNKLNAELQKGRPPKSRLSVKEVRKALSELKPE